MIEVKGLTKRYGTKRGVEDVTFHVNKGEIVGLLGPNGAGKSTIMKMLTGYHMMTAGTITVDGYDMLENPEEVMKRIGFMPEIPPLYLEMEVGEYLKFSASIKGIPKKEQAAHIEELLKLTSIEEVRDRPIGNLSKGYRQRVGLAQALIGYPEILILDEPTAGLDPRQITEVRDLLKKLSEKHTIIVSSHILAEVGQTCEKVIIINEGRIVAEDTMDNLRKGQPHSDRFRIKVGCEKSVLDAALAGVEAIRYTEPCEDFADDGDKRWFTVVGEDSDQLRQQVAWKLAQQNIPLFEMNSSKLSLEQIFLNLTTKTHVEEHESCM